MGALSISTSLPAPFESPERGDLVLRWTAPVEIVPLGSFSCNHGYIVKAILEGSKRMGAANVRFSSSRQSLGYSIGNGLHTALNHSG